MSAPPRPLTPEAFSSWLDGAFIGPPSSARAYCEATMSPNYLRLQAQGGATNFEQAVEKVTFFRTHCKKWVGKVDMLVQEGNKVAVRLTCTLHIGEDEEKVMELMFMAERDGEGRFEKVWELVMPIEGGK
ncbi:hypothetical protein VTL71DRAFT_9625 [Oculimacula yallundae]|uniref:SnoaL-like domain-containing protein n=1 Tax=Oculimacula yallundae TaxID=86028 RepID=A0ABR4BRE2_9HELO